MELFECAAASSEFILQHLRGLGVESVCVCVCVRVLYTCLLAHHDPSYATCATLGLVFLICMFAESVRSKALQQSALLGLDQVSESAMLSRNADADAITMVTTYGLSGRSLSATTVISEKNAWQEV